MVPKGKREIGKDIFVCYYKGPKEDSRMFCLKKPPVRMALKYVVSDGKKG